MKVEEIFLLDEICNVEYGTRVVQKRDGGSGYPVYGGGGATFQMDKFNREDRLVVARFGMSEECARFVSGKFFLNDSGLTVSPKSHNLLTRFLDYQILYMKDLIYALGKGAAQKNLDLSAFRQLRLFVPADTNHQRHIIRILDDTFAGIATAKANTEKNLPNARALLEGYRQAVFTQRKGGKEKRLGELASFRNGINFTKSSRGDSVKIIGVRDFQNNYWAPLDNLDAVTIDSTLTDSDTLKTNDILFVRSNGNVELIGRCLLVGAIKERTTFSGFTIRARLNGSDVLPRFLCHYLKSNKARRSMIDGGIGTNIKSLNQATLSELIVPLPPVDEQAFIVEQLEGIGNECQRLETIYRQKLVAFEALKKSLLHQAFSGQLSNHAT